jgi:hypothetical protein
MEMTRAIDAAWRKAKLSTVAILSVAGLVREVMAKCPDADERYIGRELRRRIEAYRPRHRREEPAR